MNLNLYDKDLNRIAIIGSQYVSCLWSEGYNTVENFTLELNSTDDYKKKVQSDFYVGRDDRTTLMVIKAVRVAGGKIVASGKQSTRVLDDVSFVGTIESGSMIDTSIKNAYNSSNKYHNVEFADTNLQIQYDHQISNKSFLELCETMCQSKDVGLRAVRSGGVVSVEFYQPEEKENLVFREEFGNLTIDSMSTSTENYKNYAIVLGEGEGESRIRVDVDLTNGSERREMIVEAVGLNLEDGETEESYRSRLEAMGAEKLLEKTKTMSCAFTPYANDFGKKYDLGDLLTVLMPDYGITLKARVSKFTQKSQNNKTTTSIEVGEITIKR